MVHRDTAAEIVLHAATVQMMMSTTDRIFIIVFEHINQNPRNDREGDEKPSRNEDGAVTYVRDTARDAKAE